MLTGWLCALAVSVGIAAAESSKEHCVRVGHLPFEDRTEVGAEELHSLLSGCAHPKYEEPPQPHRLLNPTAANNDVWFLWQTSGWPMQSVSLALSTSPTPYMYLTEYLSSSKLFFINTFIHRYSGMDPSKG